MVGGGGVGGWGGGGGLGARAIKFYTKKSSEFG